MGDDFMRYKIKTSSTRPISVGKRSSYPMLARLFILLSASTVLLWILQTSVLSPVGFPLEYSSAQISLKTSCEKQFERLIASSWSREFQVVILVESNFGFQSMLRNWILHLEETEKNNLRNAVIVALDERTQLEISAGTVSVFYDDCENASHHFEAQEFRTEGYNKIVFHKWFITQRALEAGANVILSDTDVVWLKDPVREILRDHSTCDIALSNDDLLSEGNPTWMNTGFGLFRNTSATRQCIRDFIAWAEKSRETTLHGFDDQFAWQTFLEKQFTVRSSVKGSPCRQYVGRGITFSIEILPAKKFMDFRQWNGTDDSQKSEAFTLHYNWLRNFEMKSVEMKKNGHWLVEPRAVYEKRRR